MGYTHYWEIKKQPTNKQWAQIQTAVEKLVNLKKVKPLIRYESDVNRPPLVCQEFVRFNGRGDEGHETFYFSREKSGFEFCKTARKPYDEAVTACLCIAEHYAPDCYVVKSDGGSEDWEKGRTLAEKVTGLGEDMRIPKLV